MNEVIHEVIPGGSNKKAISKLMFKKKDLSPGTKGQQGYRQIVSKKQSKSSTRNMATRYRTSIYSSFIEVPKANQNNSTILKLLDKQKKKLNLR